MCVVYKLLDAVFVGRDSVFARAGLAQSVADAAIHDDPFSEGKLAHRCRPETRRRDHASNSSSGSFDEVANTRHDGADHAAPACVTPALLGELEVFGRIWMLGVFRFAGMSLRDDGIAIDSRLPGGWHSLAFRVHWHGRGLTMKLIKQNTFSTQRWSQASR